MRLHTLAEIYGVPADEAVVDVDWLAVAGSSRWPVFMKDERIRYRSAEREVLLRHGVRAFCLTGGNLRAADMAAQLLGAMDDIADACDRPGPFLYSVSGRGLRKLDLA
jgi:hypothetical protein